MNTRFRDIFLLVVLGMLMLLMACKPSLDSKDPNEQLRALQVVTNQSELAQIAVEDKYVSVRDSAIEKLTDYAVLAQLVVEHVEDLEGGLVTKGAGLDKVLAQPVLERRVIEEMDPRLRKAAEILWKAQSACSLIPKEHRARFTYYFVKMFRALSDPSVASEIGENAR